jgi:hypothetical protein
MELQVRVWGMDSGGKLFSIEAVTRDITAVGACIQGSLGFLQRGAVIGVECEGRRARFRVAWVAEKRIGVRCIEAGRYIWGLPLKRTMEAIPGGGDCPPLKLSPTGAAIHGSSRALP